MAVFPQGKTRIRERVRGGEKRLFEALARQLEDDYTVWHNIPILGSGREPDFVILHPQRGLLILEVKDWRLATLRDANPMQVELLTERGLVSVVHPLSQARAYAMDVHRLFERHPALCHPQGLHKGKVLIPWGWGAALTHIKRAEVADNSNFHAVFEPAKVLLADDLAEEVDSMAFQERLWGMFIVHWQPALTLPQLSLVRGLLFPELRLGEQKALPLDASIPALVVRDVLQVMDLNQEAIARSLGEGHRLIHGPAGSGKTMLLIYRAVQLQAAARPDKPILVLCYNKALANRIDAILRLKGTGPSVQVRTFHSWARELVRTYQLGRVDHLHGDELFRAVAHLACDGIAAARVPQGQYTALLIDEAHDLADEWITAAVKMVDPATKSLLVLYDDAQSIYQKRRRKLSFAKLGVEARGRTEILKINYRNTREVLALALECARPILQAREPTDGDDVPLVLPDSAGRTGETPVFRRFDGPQAEARAIAARVKELIAEGRRPADIAVIARQWWPLEKLQAELMRAGVAAAPSRDHRRGDAPHAETVTLTTLHSSKGLEFPVVLLISLNLLDAREENFAEEVRLLYVGMTRATHELHLSTAAASPFADAVEAAIARL
jgi:type II secretory pathway predicted ATPase ExeA